ncbi:MAG: cupredoxin domain-containing protein [Phycisphaerales bacterium]
MAPIRNICALAIATAALAAVTAPAGAQSVFHTVNVFDFYYSNNLRDDPIVSTVIINPGDWVRWLVYDDLHDTVACSEQAEFWQSEIMFAGGQFDYQFSIPGTYNYYCSMHADDNGDGTATGMIGTVIVIPAPGPAAAILGAAVFTASRRRRSPPRSSPPPAP